MSNPEDREQVEQNIEELTREGIRFGKAAVSFGEASEAVAGRGTRPRRAAAERSVEARGASHQPTSFCSRSISALRAEISFSASSATR